MADWRNEVRKCLCCGDIFLPTHRGQGCCGEDCFRAYNVLPAYAEERTDGRTTCDA